MPRIIIRNSDRRILFFSHADLRDLDPTVQKVRGKYARDETTLFSPFSLPNNIRLGGYLDIGRTLVEHRPHGDLRTVEERRDEINKLIDGQLANIKNGALLSVPDDGKRLYHKYLRMLVQASLQDAALRDLPSWTLIKAGGGYQPWDLVDLSSRQAEKFRACFGDAGAYAKGWWDASARAHSLKAASGNTMLIPSQVTTYDFRVASVVPLIPSSEIDRTDTALRNSQHPWTGRAAMIAKINARLPWYQPSFDATLSGNPVSRPANFTTTTTWSPSVGYYVGSTSESFLAFRPALSSNRAILAVTVNGVAATDPFTVNAVLNRGTNQVVLTVTAQDQETTMTYTYDINRTG